MSSPRNMKFAALLASSLTASCVTDANLGSSEMLDLDGPQSVVGTFHYDARPAVADFNGDGFDDLAVWTIEGQDYRPLDGFVGAPPSVYLYYGRENGLPAHLGAEDADASLSVRTGEYVVKVQAHDVDGDGAAELIVHACVQRCAWGRQPPIPDGVIPNGGSVYVVAGGPTLDAPLALADVTERIPSYPTGGDGPVTMTLAPQDIDGEPGAEFLTQTIPSGGWQYVTEAVHVRSLDTGALGATLTLPSTGTIDARAVFDYDADGHADVVVFYVLAPERTDVLNADAWTEYGLGVFYGPITADRTLGDPQTEKVEVLSLPGLEFGFLEGGAARTVVGNFVGDENPDILLWMQSGTSIVRAGGARANPQGLYVSNAAYGDFGRENEELALTVPGRGAAGQDALFLLGGSELGTVRIGARGWGAGSTRTEGSELISAPRTTGEGSPQFSESGGAVGDLDGNGKLDIVLGTRWDHELNEIDTRVHILYDFGS